MAARIRIVATLIVLAGMALAALYVFANKPNGTFGLDGAFLPGPAAFRVDAVDGGGGGALAGISAGEILRPVAGGRDILYLLANPPIVASGDVVRAAVSGTGAARIVTLRAVRNANSPPFEGIYFCILAAPILLLGWFIVWRKPKDVDALTLGLMLLLFALAILTPDRIGGVYARLAVYELMASSFFIFAVFAANIFFAGYPAGAGLQHSRFRRGMLVAAIASLSVNLSVMAITYLRPELVGSAPWIVALSQVVVLLPQLVTLACVWDAFRHAGRADRTRLRWLAGSYFVGFSGPMFLPAVSLFLGSQFTVVDQALLESTLFFLAAGLTYAILKRRVVDVAFVLNRALVFSLVSGVVVASFIALEWIVGALFVNLSRPTSFAIEGAVAVLIGFSLRPIHNRADLFIDRVFFAKRHQAESALRKLATEVTFIRDRGALLERLKRDLTVYLEATSVSVYARDSMQSDFLLLSSTMDALEVIDADDDASVALAVEERPLELHGRATHIPGELAVPLAVRKSLTGILVLGHKSTGEAFAPDELTSLQFLAGYLGLALAASGALPANDAGEPTLRDLLHEMRLQRAEIADLSARLDKSDAGRPR